MARRGFWTGGFGSLLAECPSLQTTTVGAIPATVTLDTGVTRSGPGSIKFNPAATAAEVTAYAIALGSPGFIRFYLKVTVLPNVITDIGWKLYGQSGAGQVAIRLTVAGAIVVGTGTPVGTSTTLLTDPNKWYRIEYWQDGAGNCELRIDGRTEFTSASGPTTSTNDLGDSGTTTTCTYYMADIAYDSTEWVGDSNLAVLLPTADSQRGTWTGGAGGTTNLFEAINNTPPIGTATETDLTQIENVDTTPDNSTDEYRVTMQTYAAAGVRGRVRDILRVIWHGEDVATGTKTGSCALFSNPAELSYKPFTFGEDVGALGTWPTNWRKTTPSPLVDNFHTENPTVDLAVAPVVAIRKTDTGNRVVSVCFLALIVEYIPETANPLVVPSPAVNRASRW